MRIANASVTRNYLNGLQKNHALLVRYNEQVYTGQRFKTMSEDPANGVRAMQTRRELIRVQSYLENAKMAKDKFESAEGLVANMGDITSEIQKLFIQGMNGTYDSEDRKYIYTQIENLQNELLSLANGKFGTNYLFGATNTTSQPFTVDANGALLYNGQDVTTIAKGDPCFDAEAWIEIGLGVNFDGTASDTQVNPSSGLKITFNGLELLGFGSSNLYNLTTEMLTMLNDPNKNADDMGPLLDKFQSSMANIRTERTRIGTQYDYLDFTIDRLEAQRLTLTTRQQTIEGKDSTEAITDLTMQEYVYNAALSMGQRLLQPTLFNFMS